MDKWYEELVDEGERLGVDRALIDTFADEYDRQLEPLQALILRMHDAGLCSENGDFGPEWQGIGPYDAGAAESDESDESDEEDP